MKSTLILISSFFLIGVFGDSVSVMKENSVTLHTDRTEIQRADTVEWRFNGSRIARISMDSTGVISDWVSSDGASRDRLQLDKQTGDLKITKFRTTDSGQYLLKIKSIRGSSEKMFSVNYVDKDPVKVSGTVGGFVTLKPEKRSDELIQWRFVPQNTLIAELLANSSTVYPDERFRDRLKLNIDTGSLNITDITITDSEDYEAGIRSRGSSYTIHKTFSVTVRDVNSMSVKEGGSVSLRIDLTKIQTNDVILWMFGDQGIIASLNGPVVDPRWSNVHLNKQTGELTIRNIQRDQSGDYKVEFNTTNMISHRKYRIIISAAPDSDLSTAAPDSGLSTAAPDSGLSTVVPDSDLSSAAVAGMVTAVLAAVAAAVGGLIYYCYKNSKPERSREENGQNHTSNKDEETGLTKTAKT